MTQKIAFSSFSAYTVAPLAEGHREDLRDGIHRCRFRECLPSQATSQGFTGPTQPGQAPLDGMLDCGRWVAVGLRVDEKKIPAALLRLRCAEAERLWADTNGREPPPGVKRELAETVKLDLLKTVPPTPATALLLYDQVDGRLLVGGSGSKVHEAAQKLWKEATGSRVRPRGLLDSCAEVLDDATLAHLALDGDGAREAIAAGEHVAMKREQLGRFLTWLWHRGEASTEGLARVQSRDGNELRWLARDKVDLADAETGKTRVSVRAADAAADPALRVALVEGHDVCGLELDIHREAGWELRLALGVKDGELAITALKTGPVAGNEEEQLLAIAFNAELADWAVQELFLAWAKVAGHPERQPQALASLKTWLENQVFEWASKRTSWGEGLAGDGAA